jgi:serine/threonine protein kinase
MVSFVEYDIIDTLILCDFGTAAVLGDMDILISKTYTGTSRYIAPEIQSDREKNQYNPFKADSKTLRSVLF